jgi:uncharacterized protein (TIGR02996 family)
MNAEAGFLAAIREAPEDDAPRLVYADWLEEGGDKDRAEFIRMQCALERLPMDAPQRPELEDRADDLLAEHEERWLGPPPPWLYGWTFRRGFAESLSFTDGLPRDRSGALLDGHPLTDVTVFGWGKRLFELLRVPLPSWHPGLRIAPQVHAVAASLLPDLAHPHAARVVALHHPRSGSEWETIAALPCAATLTGLTGLTLIPDVEFTAVAPALPLRNGTLPALSQLHHCWAGEAEPEDLAPLLARSADWVELRLSALAPATLERLSDFARLRRLAFDWPATSSPPRLVLPSRLTDLEIRVNGMNRHLLRALATADGLERLRSLQLRRSYQDQSLPEDWTALGEVMGRLRGPVLRLEAEMPGFLRSLTRLPHLGRVAALVYCPADPDPADLDSLIECPGFTGVRELTLGAFSLKEGSARRLAAAPALQRLRKLSLFTDKIWSPDLNVLLNSPHLRRLVSLTLCNVASGSSHAQILEEWPGLSRLRDLTLWLDRRSWKRLPPRLAGLSPLARFTIPRGQFPPSEKEISVFAELRARHGCRVSAW